MSVRLSVFLAVVLAGAAQAQTRYVSDRTIVELRRGPSTEYLILRNLEAGAELELLEQNAEAGYSRVRVRDQGTEGWILTRFLTPQPIARDALASAERNLAAARARVSVLEEQTNELSGQLQATKSELEVQGAAHGAASKELEEIRVAAANVVAIREQNASLQQKLIQREREVEELSTDNARLASRSAQNWFVVGAGVLLAGIVLGLVAPSLRRKRRSDW